MGIKLIEQRGKNKTLESQRNKQKIKDWFKEHPSGTQKQCSADLGLSRMTVNKHLEALRSR